MSWLRPYCKSKECKKHTFHKVTEIEKGKDGLVAQGKHRYDRKQSWYGGQTNQSSPRRFLYREENVTILAGKTKKLLSQAYTVELEAELNH
ncbi:hypothetical protein HS088_TW20G00415 [Tripterygium wilfordii]|uniref:Uncharacterized protein n=1 Tax=Tripterygium wilfordii TaxID=458696 RepID=A0A7J7C7X7_TRIWF|nr:hypothetical protein HS088_TW20G00415 [Tripterygium wilfordii]